MTLLQFLTRLRKQHSNLSTEEKAYFILFWLALRSQYYLNDSLESILQEILQPININLKKAFLNTIQIDPDNVHWSEIIELYDSNTRKHLNPFLLVSFLSSLTKEPNDHRFARWIHEVSKNIGCPEDFVDIILGWRIDSSNEEFAQTVNTLISRWKSGNSMEQFVAEYLQPAKRFEELDFLQIRKQFQAHLLGLRMVLNRLNIQVSLLDNIEIYLKEPQFRLAIMGEFKRGKSSLVNALLDNQNLTPVDDLPCTSSLIEFHYASQLRFQRRENNEFITYSYEEFQENVSQASQNHSSISVTNTVIKEIPFWKVHCPSSFLKETSVTLIDTPGLGEDIARDIISKREAKRTDLAIIVFDPEQLVSLIELDLIGEMGAYAKDLFIVINKSDRILDNQQKDRSREHVITRLNQATGTDFSKRVYFVSAKNVQQDIQNNTTSKWTDEFRQLRLGLRHHLKTRIGSLKLEQLRGKTQILSKEILLQTATHLKHLNYLFENWRTAEIQKQNAQISKMNAEKDMSTATKIIQDFGTPTSQKLFASFQKKAVPQAIQRLEIEKSKWSLENNVFSPKKLAQEIGEVAQKTFIESIATWSENEAAQLVTKEIESSFEQAQQATPNLQAYLVSQGGYDPTTIITDLQKRAIEGAFGTTIDLNTAEIAIKGSISTILSVILGYIVADIILYYWLSLISGFLHPALLAAAVVVSIPIIFFGQEIVKEHLKDKIINEIKKKMLEDNTISNKLKLGLDEAMEKIFGDLANNFQTEVHKIIIEVDYNYRKSCQLVEESIKDLNENPEFIETKLNKINKENQRVKTILTQMQNIVGLK